MAEAGKRRLSLLFGRDARYSNIENLNFYRVFAGWYQATVNGKNGVCPSNFVELVPDDLPDLIMAKSETSTNKELKERLSNSLNRTPGKDSETAAKRQSLFDPLAPTTPKTPESAGTNASDSKSTVHFFCGNVRR